MISTYWPYRSFVEDCVSPPKKRRTRLLLVTNTQLFDDFYGCGIIFFDDAFSLWCLVVSIHKFRLDKILNVSFLSRVSASRGACCSLCAMISTIFRRCYPVSNVGIYDELTTRFGERIPSSGIEREGIVIPAIGLFKRCRSLRGPRATTVDPRDGVRRRFFGGCRPPRDTCLSRRGRSSWNHVVRHPAHLSAWDGQSPRRLCHRRSPPPWSETERILKLNSEIEEMSTISIYYYISIC